MTEPVTYESFVDLVDAMVKNRESGSLYLCTERNHSVYIGIRNGEIESLVSGPRRGLEAMKMVLGMVSGRCRRDKLSVAIPSGDLPPTNEILRIFRAREGLSNPLAESATSAGWADTAGQAIEGAQTAMALCELLHDYLGPAAVIICEEITQNGDRLQTRSDLDEVIREMASEIESGEEAREFVRRAQQRTGLAD